MKIKLNPNDVKCVVNARAHVMKCFTPQGLKWTIPCHGEGVEGPGFDTPGGDTPPGMYEIGLITKTQTSEPQSIWNAYGRWFCDLVELENQEASRGRAGCGVHGGGSASPNPLAPDQGFYPTLGCLRLLNKDLENVFVPMVQYVKKNKGKIYVEVVW